MKKAFSILFLISCASCLMCFDLHAQGNAEKKTSSPNQIGSDAILRDAQDKPYVIGDDGQKVYFLVDPVRKDAPTQKQSSTPSSLPANAEPRKPE